MRSIEGESDATIGSPTRARTPSSVAIRDAIPSGFWRPRCFGTNLPTGREREVMSAPAWSPAYGRMPAL